MGLVRQPRPGNLGLLLDRIGVCKRCPAPTTVLNTIEASIKKSRVHIEVASYTTPHTSGTPTPTAVSWLGVQVLVADQV